MTHTVTTCRRQIPEFLKFVGKQVTMLISRVVLKITILLTRTAKLKLFSF